MVVRRKSYHSREGGSPQRLAEARIQCFQCFMDPPVKPEDDKIRLYGQTLNSILRFRYPIKKKCEAEREYLSGFFATLRFVIPRLDRGTVFQWFWIVRSSRTMTFF